MDTIIERIADYPNLAEDDRTKLVKDIRRSVMAGMESGNPGVARLYVTELAEFNAQAAFAIRADVISTYGRDL